MSSPTTKRQKNAASDLTSLTDDLVREYQQNGFLVFRNFFSSDEVEAIKNEMSRVIDEWYVEFDKTGEEGADWEEVVNRDPLVRQGKLKPLDRLHSVRRLFRISVNLHFFKQIASHPKMLAISKQLLGDDVKLLQSMALLKPPGTAEKKWHQDNAYFRLIPNHLLAFWIALDEADVENGCMHIVPKSHNHGVDDHSSPDDDHVVYSLTNLPEKDKIVSVPLSPGDALLFHGELQHYTPSNNSIRMRRAIQMHYASGQCKPTVCPKDGEEKGSEGLQQEGPTHFDCAPCIEPKFWYYRKAELLVSGHDYGGEHI